MTNATRPVRPLAGAERPQPTTAPALTIPSRFCGPPGSGNGGYVCGRIAAYLDDQVTVTLRQPPPLAAPMTVERSGENSVRIHHGPTLIAEATSSPGSPEMEIPGLVSMAEARAAAGRARYYSDPMFPACFVCGTGRQPGDGLRIFPGPVAGRPLWAAPWTPDISVTDTSGRVLPEVVWAALDCPSGIAAAEANGLGQDTAILLGRMTASLAALPVAGDQYCVIAWPGARDSRKLTAGSALLGPAGQVLAAATAVWLTVPRPVLAAEGAS
jgi:NAD(P)H-hydrate repair Nnr-like enzyme with NAD(P)H-hydrate epimerase domain